MTRYILPLLLVASLAQYSFADDDEIKNVPMQQTHLIDDRPPPKKLLLFPAPEPRIAFEHHLLPQEHELQEGDAAAFYAKAFQLYTEAKPTNPSLDELLTDVDDAGDKPFTQFPIVKAKKILSTCGHCLEYVHYGAVRRQCHWPVPYNDSKGPVIAIVLPEVNAVRHLSRLLVIEARVAVYENRPLDALRSIKAGYALGRHVNEGRFLVQGLVGCAIVGMMNETLWEVVQQPDCPNLYWSLTELPSPLLSGRFALESEYDIVFKLVPELRKIGHEKFSQEEYNSILLKLVTTLQQFGGMKLGDGEEMSQELKAQALSTFTKTMYPAARTKLIDAGYSVEKVNAMGSTEAILMNLVDANRKITSDLLKFSYLPEDELRNFESEPDQKALAKLEVMPLTSMLAPGARSARMAYIRRSREIAVLRTYEAIRIHTSKTGSLPNELSEVKVVPVPNDPTSGKPFEYKTLSERVAGGKSEHGNVSASLRVGNSLKTGNPYDELRFEITLVKNKEDQVKQLATDKKAHAEKLAAMPPKPKEEPIVENWPGPEDEKPVVAKDQKYYEPNPDIKSERAVKQAYAAMHKQSFTNVKQMMLALLTLAEKNRAYPAAYIADKDGKPLLSWRVMILPYIEQKALYDQFKLDEPWDSEHNKKLISKMPTVFASPLMKPLEKGKTCYLVPFGKETIFTGATGTKFAQVRDGVSKTVAIVEAAPESAVEWTKPQDWNFDSTAKEPFKGLFGLRESGVVVGFGDGSAQLIGPSENRWLVKSIMTKANADVYKWSAEIREERGEGKGKKR